MGDELPSSSQAVMHNDKNMRSIVVPKKWRGAVAKTISEKKVNAKIFGGVSPQKWGFSSEKNAKRGIFISYKTLKSEKNSAF